MLSHTRIGSCGTLVSEHSLIFVTADTLKRRNPAHRGYVGGMLYHMAGTYVCPGTCWDNYLRIFDPKIRMLCSS